MAQSAPRKRVTREDIRKREIKLDIVERPIPPPLAWRYMTPIILLIPLWIMFPAQGVLWLALTATALWVGCFGMRHAERKRKDTDVGREFILSIACAGTMGLAIGCWGFFAFYTFGQ